MPAKRRSATPSAGESTVSQGLLIAGGIAALVLLGAFFKVMAQTEQGQQQQNMQEALRRARDGENQLLISDADVDRLLRAEDKAEARAARQAAGGQGAAAPAPVVRPPRPTPQPPEETARPAATPAPRPAPRPVPSPARPAATPRPKARLPPRTPLPPEQAEQAEQAEQQPTEQQQPEGGGKPWEPAELGQPAEAQEEAADAEETQQARSPQPRGSSARLSGDRELLPRRTTAEFNAEEALLERQAFGAVVPRAEPKRSADPPQRFLVTAFIGPNLVQAASHGLHHFFRLAAMMKRAAVLPRVRATNPAFRTTEHPSYFDVDSFFDTPRMLERWGDCVQTAGTADWKLWTGGKIDTLLVFDERDRKGVQRRCTDHSNQFDALWAGKPVKQFRRNIRSPYIAAESLAGYYKVKEIACLSTREAANVELWPKFIKQLSDVRTLGIVQAGVWIARQPWSRVCPGASLRAYSNPKVRTHSVKLAAQWKSLSRAIIPDPGRVRHVCVYVAAATLADEALAKQDWPRGGREHPVLDRCIDNIHHIVDRRVRAKWPDQADQVRRFVVSDVALGRPVDDRDLRSSSNTTRLNHWYTRAARVAARIGAGFCGTAEHRNMIQAGQPAKGKKPPREVAGIMYISPRACTLAETAVCRQAPLQLRFGDGDMSSFHAPQGSLYRTCATINSNRNAGTYRLPEAEADRIPAPEASGARRRHSGRRG
eukprot:TRINITY_DN11887_c0_g3_i2.p1 TRINITY_DN11887_c0_g3~~TRINITY_DN11887_c0_g3_i2.p1  ORF type:complete len:749 (+),score=133.65 TRINITY_DN11887_c0_g3_i2:112-2247(+)